MKRAAILEHDRRGSYIPVCTRNVFLKYYTDAEGQQIHFWGQHDREDYLARDATACRALPARRGRDRDAGYLTSYVGLF